MAAMLSRVTPNFRAISRGCIPRRSARLIFALSFGDSAMSRGKSSGVAEQGETAQSTLKTN
jgi:hypothetical protein